MTMNFIIRLLNITENYGHYRNTDATTRDASDAGFYNTEENNFICYQGLQAERSPNCTFSVYDQYRSPWYVISTCTVSADDDTNIVYCILN